MINEEPPSSFAVEAASMDTDPTRLADLVRYPILAPIVAENPSVNLDTLTHLYKLNIPEVRRGLARNPSVPMDLLFLLAREYPADFLQNPLLPMLNLAQPDFAKKIPALAWAGLLRCENIPPLWFKLIKADYRFQRYNLKTWESMQMHVTLGGEAPTDWRQIVATALKKYQQKLVDELLLSSDVEFSLLLLFVMLFPQVAPMLRERWARYTAASMDIRDKILPVLAAGIPIGTGGLKVLTRTDDVNLQIAVARHALTPARILAHFTTHGRPAVRRAVAGNPHTSAKDILTLTGDADATVRQRAVSHHTLSSQNLTYLRYDDDASVRAAIATRHGLDDAFYAELARDAASKVRKALARNVQIPQDVLCSLAVDSESEVRSAAASNPRLPLDLVEALARDEAEVVRASIGDSARLTADVAGQLLQDQSIKVRNALAANPRTPSAVLDVLLQTGEMEIWQGLARQPHLEPAQLVYLAKHGDLQVRSAVAAHKRTPIEMLEQLAREDRKEIWQALASNPHTPLTILKCAIETEDYEIWFRVMNHPAMMRCRRQPFLELLRKKMRTLIINDELPAWFRKAVWQYYPSLPAAIVETFAISLCWEERYLVTRYPYVTPTTLEALAHDGNQYVRAAARAVQQQPLDAVKNNEKRRPDVADPTVTTRPSKWFSFWKRRQRPSK
ncbi:hypothetical protein [Dictyobacter formicarum]|uniref:Leucine rich repeat variant n=1 Tax=Dictyobacter formicarum TaxID=2778368 RepID=A0ABQ3VRH1_9CHLR|nr:hypothetical protein [Dictyobacter formicarum]GHO88477.1 hypothetical protein KSZ_64830 [Dictyobacter formicarum]